MRLSPNHPVFLVAIVVLTGTLGFGLGRLSKIEEGREPVKIVNAAAVAETSSVKTSVAKPATGQYVASKNGTRYYLLNCSGVKQIKEGNKVYFATKEAAEKAGLQPAVNCPGI